MSLGTFQKEILTLEISKQLEHEATAQVKSKLVENSNATCAYVPMPVAPFPSRADPGCSCQGSRVCPCLGSRGLRRLLSSQHPGLPARPAVPVRGIRVLGRRLSTGQRRGSPEAPAPGASTPLVETEVGSSQGKRRQARPHHCEPS